MNRTIAVLTALALVLFCGITHGIRSDRWQTSEALNAALERVADVPLEVGDWVAKPVEGDARSFELAGAQTYWVRQYRNERKKAEVLVILMCGRAGRMAVHTPEVCYQGAGYELFDTPLPTTLRSEWGDEVGAFYTARFVKASGLGADLRLCWAWNARGVWQAPASPRWEFRGQRFLYKLYVSHNITGRPTSLEDDTAMELLRALAPELKKTLFPKEV